MALTVVRSYHEAMEVAKEAEKAGDPARAAGLYETAIKKQPQDETAYNRLMIIYRKEKNYEDELRIIKMAIKNFQAINDKRTKKLTANKTIVQASNALAKSLGLTDKKGKEVYVPEPVNSWMKRQIVVEKKIANPPKTKTKKKK